MIRVAAPGAGGPDAEGEPTGGACSSSSPSSALAGLGDSQNAARGPSGPRARGAAAPDALAGSGATRPEATTRPLYDLMVNSKHSDDAAVETILAAIAVRQTGAAR